MEIGSPASTISLLSDSQHDSGAWFVCFGELVCQVYPWPAGRGRCDGRVPGPLHSPQHPLYSLLSRTLPNFTQGRSQPETFGGSG